MIVLGGGMCVPLPLAPGHVHRCPNCYEAVHCTHDEGDRV